MPISSLVSFPILLGVGIVTLFCGRSIMEGVGQWEPWAIASVITMLVTLTTVGAVV